LAFALPVLLAFAPSTRAHGVDGKHALRQEAGHEATASKPMGWTGVLDEESFKALHELRTDAAPELHGSMMDLAGGRAYLSLPAGEGPFPAIVVIHEWWGLNDHIKHWADRLAADGYAAIAVDLYEGKIATTSDEANAAMLAVDETRALEVLHAGYEFLGTDPRVMAPRRGSVGWCFGGGWSLRLAIAEPGLDAAVIYYGRLVDDAAQLAKIKASVCGIFGNLDQGIPPEAVSGFEKGLAAANVTHEIHRYDANHAFANPSGGRYEPEAAEAAWAAVREFLAHNLKASPSE
jgi:carboxymethylenebutenolidase